VRKPANRRGARRRRSQGERSAETRRRLIAAAVRIIAADGYAAATTTAIAREAGVSRGALQHQFGTRYELLAAVSDRLTEEMLAVDRRLRAGGSLERRVHAALMHYWRVYSGPAFLAVLNIRFGATGEAPLSARLRRHYAGIDRGSDAPWLALFADTGIPRRRLAALKRAALGSLRGLAVARFLGLMKGTPAAEMRLIEAALVRALRR
jgi:AcrR family transcriptional regulator